MKKLLIVLFLAFASYHVVLAQDTHAKESAGQFGLSFDLGGLANLGLNAVGGGSINDSTEFTSGLGFIWYLADKLALRGIIGFQNVGTTISIKRDSTTLEEKTSATAITIAPSVVYNIASAGPVSGFVGGGVQFLTASTSPTHADTSASVTKTSFTSFGIGAIFGAEWFPWSNLGLSAEYGLSYSTTSGTSTFTFQGKSTDTDLPSAHFFGISGSGTIMATFYF